MYNVRVLERRIWMLVACGGMLRDVYHGSESAVEVWPPVIVGVVAVFL